MFSLIVTVISIALVAALALATIYYGGDAYTQGTDRAHAAKLRIQGQQLLAATDFYYTQKGIWPRRVEDLVEDKFLNALPVAYRSVAEAVAATESPWSMPVSGVPVFTIPTIAPETCRGVNEATFGERGIAVDLSSAALIQCFGQSTGSLVTVVSRATPHLQTAVNDAPAGVALASASIGNRPTSDTDEAWLVRPSAPIVSASSEGVPGGGEPEEPEEPEEVKPPMTVTSVSQYSFEVQGGAPGFSIVGTEFDTDSTVYVGAQIAACSVVSASHLSCTPPAMSAGSYDLRVVDASDSRSVSAGNVSYAALAISSMSAEALSTDGGQTLTIHGQGFMPGIAATAKGSIMACSVTDDRTLNCLTPVSSAGAGTIVVSNANGSTASIAVVYEAPINYAILDVGRKAWNITLSNENRTAMLDTGAWSSVFSNTAKSTGKYYVELTSAASSFALGIVAGSETDTTSYTGTKSSGIQYLSGGSVRIANSGTGSALASASSGSIVGMSVDLDAKTLQFRVKSPTGACGLFSSDYSFSSGMYPPNPADFRVAVSVGNPGNSVTMNFGKTPFVCPVPAGFKAGWY